MNTKQDTLLINRGIKDIQNQYILEFVSDSGRPWKVYFDSKEELVKYAKVAQVPYN